MKIGNLPVRVFVKVNLTQEKFVYLKIRKKKKTFCIFFFFSKVGDLHLRSITR